MQIQHLRYYPSGFARMVYGDFDSTTGPDQKVVELLKEYYKGTFNTKKKLELIDLAKELFGDFKLFLKANQDNDRLTTSGKDLLFDLIQLVNGKKMVAAPSTRLATLVIEQKEHIPGKVVKGKFQDYLIDQKTDHTIKFLMEQPTDVIMSYLFVIFGYGES